MANQLKENRTSGCGISSAVSNARSLTSWLSRDWLLGLILVLAVIAAYQPVWHAGFIWDDSGRILANPCIVGPLGLKEIWTTSAADICPLVMTTFWAEYAWWGPNPLPYHFVNVFQQAGCAVLFWRVLRSLDVPGAWLGAALWALHPVEVESVAWIAEMKNTESGLFFLLAIFFFVKWLRELEPRQPNRGRWSYGLTLLFSALAMASKSSTVILPIVLCLCAMRVEGQWQWRNLVRLTPIFLMSIASGVASMWTQVQAGANDPHWARSWPERMVGAGDAIWFYLGKLLWPHPLIMIYPRWKIDAGQGMSYVPLLLALALLILFWLKRETWSRPYFLVWAYFLVALLPALDFVNTTYSRYSLVADHFQYLASMGPLALAGAGLARATDFMIPRKPWLQTILCAGLLLLVGTWSWQRVWVYESEETLWTDTLAKNPSCWAGYNNLGMVFLGEGRFDEAKVQLQRALQLNPNFVDAHNNLGDILLQDGQAEEGVAQYQAALKIDPSCTAALSNLGNAFSQKGDMDEATAFYRQALKINPLYKIAHYNLGTILLKKGQVDEAITQFEKTLEIDPGFAGAHNYLGHIFFTRGQVDEATAQFQKALQIDPEMADAHNAMGTIFLKAGRASEAMAEFQAALKIDPSVADVHYNLGDSLMQNGEVDEAMAQYQKALEINPKYAEAHNNLGIGLFKEGRLDEAIAHFQKALAINPNYASAHNNLGSALFQKGRLDEAIVQYQEVIRLNPNDGNAQSNLARAQARARQVSGGK